jgi:hypothetical protein
MFCLAGDWRLLMMSERILSASRVEMRQKEIEVISDNPERTPDRNLCDVFSDLPATAAQPASLSDVATVFELCLPI